MTLDKKILYRRQTVLPEIGQQGQFRLNKAKVAIVGCGGLGGNVAVQLAASGVGEVLLVDFDNVSLSNLHRQYFFKISDAGKNKAECLAQYLQQISPFVKTTSACQALNKENTGELLADFDIVLDCTDSLPTKYLINDYCVTHDKVLIYGSLYKHDGYVATFNHLDGKQRTANLRDAFPSMPSERIPNCEEVGTMNSIVSLVGTLQANETIKLITKTGNLLTDKVLLYNSMKNSQFIMKLQRRHGKDQTLQLWRKEDYSDPSCAFQDPKLIIDAEQLDEKLRNEEVYMISVSEKKALQAPFDISLHVPMSEFRPEELTLPQNLDVVIVCNRGISSYLATRKMKEVFPQMRVFSLSEGLEQYN